MASLESQLKKYGAGGGRYGEGDVSYQLKTLANKAGYTDSYFKKKQKDEEDKRFADKELKKANAIKAGGKLNPDGSVTPKKPGFWDYLIGEQSLFGSRNTAKVAATAEKAGENWRKGVDDFLGDEGNDKLDNWKDVARLGINLVPGMAEGLATSGKNLNEAVRGKRVVVDENGNLTGEEEDLTAKQRAAAGVVGTLDTVGLGLGGSGKFLKEIFKKPLESAMKNIAKDAAKDVTKNTAKQTAKNVAIKEAGKTAKNMGIEGAEESIQSVASDIQDDDKLSEDWVSNAGKSFALGAAAGGVFDVSGRAIGKTKEAAKTRAADKATETSTELRTSWAQKVEEARKSGLEGEDLEGYEAALLKEAQRASLINDKSVGKQEFESRATSLIDDVKNKKVDVKPEAKELYKDTISDEEAQRLQRVDSKFNEQLTEIDDKLTKLTNNELPEVKRLIANDGSDVTEIGAKYESDIKKLETQIRDLEQQADGINLTTGKADAPEGVDPSEYTGDATARSKAADQIPKLQEQIESLRAEQATQFERRGGVSEVIDTGAVRSIKKELTRQRAEIVDWKIRNNHGETAQSLQQKLDNVNRGVVSDEFVQVREPAKNVAEAVAMARDTDPSDTSELQRAAVINAIHREAANKKLDTLWTQERFTQFEKVIDDSYKAREAEIAEMPKPKQAEEMAALEQKYILSRDANQSRYEEDMDDVVAVEQALKVADDVDARIVERANSILASDPMAFGRVDEDMMIEVESSLDIAKTLKKAESDPNSVTPMESEDAVKQSLRNATDADEANTIINEDPRLKEQMAVAVADQVSAGNLKGSLWDYGVSSIRDSLLKLENGDKLVATLDTAFMEAGKSDVRMKLLAKNDGWKLTYKSEAATDQTIGYLDKGEPLSRMKGESERQFNRRSKATDSIKSWLAKKAEEQGLSKEQMIKNYFPHNFQQQFGKGFQSVAEAVARLESGLNEKGNKLTEKQRTALLKKIEGVDIATQQLIERSKIYKVGKNGHLEKRQGAEGWSRDIPFVLEMYQRMSNKSTHIQPALDKVKKMTSDLDKKQLRYVESALNVLTDKKSHLDEMMGDKVTKTMSGARRLNNMALMGLSARTVALQPFAIINNWREAPNSRQFIVSSIRAIAAFDPMGVNRTNPMVREFLEAGGMEGSFSTSLRSTKFGKLEKGMFAGITMVDRVNRLAAYDMGKQDYIKSLNKKSADLTDAELDAAKAAGVQKARDAQFGVGPMDIPIAQNSELGKMVFQLQQFNIKQFGKEVGYLMGDKDNSFIRYDKSATGLKGKVKSAHFTAKGATTLAKTVAGYAALYALYTQMQVGDDENSKNPFGFDFADVLPFGEQIMWMVEAPGKIAKGEPLEDIQSVVPPLVSATIGRSFGMGQDKGVLGHLGRSLLGGEDIDRGEEFASAMKSAIRNFAPMGTQAVRSFEGKTAVDRGESMNKSGSTRFLIDNSSGWNVMKGLVGGQYATTEGQEWLRNGMNTISKKNTVELPDGSKMPVSDYVRTEIKNPEEQAAWIGYYATKQNADAQLKKNGMSQDDVLKDIRKKLTAGTINEVQAAREAEKYNDTVRELYRPYYETIKNFPPRLADDYLDKVLISPDKALKPMRQRGMSEDRQNMLNAWYEEETIDPAEGLW